MKKLTAYILCGPPGAGKSTYSSKLSHVENATVISGDDIRFRLYGSAEIQGNWVEIHDEIERQVENASEQSKDVILDNTHYSASYRRNAIDLLRSYGYIKIEAVVINPPLETCLKRNSSRSRQVPEYIIKEMHTKFQSSLKHIDSEDFDRITYVF